MIDCGSFVKLFNQYLPAPTCTHPAWLHATKGAPEGPGGMVETTQRVTNAAWKLILEGNTGKKGVTAAAETQQHGITLGRIEVSTLDRWRIQSNIRKEGEKKGLNRTEYNKAVSRPTINMVVPTGAQGFPAGRGRPT